MPSNTEITEPRSLGYRLGGWTFLGLAHGLTALSVGAFCSLIGNLYFAKWGWVIGMVSGIAFSLYKARRTALGTGKKRRRSKVVNKGMKFAGNRIKPIHTFTGLVNRVVWAMLAGVVIGLFVALWLEMFFFSASTCPFGPADWKDALTVTTGVSEFGTGGASKSMGLSSSHPLFRYLFFGPVCICPLVGGMLAGITGIRQWCLKDKSK